MEEESGLAIGVMLGNRSSSGAFLGAKGGSDALGAALVGTKLAVALGEALILGAIKLGATLLVGLREGLEYSE
jgi:hypothetical protein